jgi:hypothetical protein
MYAPRGRLWPDGRRYPTPADVTPAPGPGGRRGRAENFSDRPQDGLRRQRRGMSQSCVPTARPCRGAVVRLLQPEPGQSSKPVRHQGLLRRRQRHLPRAHNLLADAGASTDEQYLSVIHAGSVPAHSLTCDRQFRTWGRCFDVAAGCWRPLRPTCCSAAGRSVTKPSRRGRRSKRYGSRGAPAHGRWPASGRTDLSAHGRPGPTAPQIRAALREVQRGRRGGRRRNAR